MAYSSSLEAQAHQHAKQMIDLAGKYLSSHSEAAAEALEGLYSKTMGYYHQHCNGYAGVLATHAHMLALWNVNEHFRPDDAYNYARVAQDCYQELLNSEEARNDTPQTRDAYKVYLQDAWLICAYIEYNNENLHSALDWLRKIQMDAGVPAWALTATVLLRLTMEEGMDAFMAAFNLFKAMDEQFTKPTTHVFKEDIIRTAYDFYVMYYTHAVRSTQDPMPYDPALAVRILTRAYGLLRDPQQKEFMQVCIDKARSKC